MPDYCFGLRNGFCEVMKNPHCPGYDVCPFYKPKSVNDAELKRYGSTIKKRDRLTEMEQREIATRHANGEKATDIADTLGINVHTVWSYIRQFKEVGNGK
jgi:hypothetical protein